MENLHLDNEQLNKTINPASDLPQIPRDETGKILIEKIAIGQDDKGRYIVPDKIFDTYIKELPPGTGNESKTFRAYNGGKLAQLENDPEEASKRGKVGGPASQDTQHTRRSIREILEDLSKMKATPEEIEEYGLKEGTTLLEAVNLAQVRRAMKGDTKAAEYVRDTLGEKPTDKFEAELTQITPEMEDLVKRVASRPEIIE